MINKKNIFLAHKFNILILIALLIFSSFLDIFSLMTIPIFFGGILENDTFLKNIGLDFVISKLNIKNNNLLYLSLLVFLAFLLKNIFQYLTLHFESNFIKKIRIYLNSNLYKKYISLRFDDFKKKKSQIIINNLTSEVNTLCTSLHVYIILFREFFLIILLFLTLIYTDYKITFIIIFFITFFVSIFIFFTKKKLLLFGKEAKNSRTKKLNMINILIGSYREIKILSLKNFFWKKFNNHLYEEEQRKFYLEIISKLPKIYLEILSILAILFAFYYFNNQGLNTSELLPVISFFVIVFARSIPLANSVSFLLSKLKYNKVSEQTIISELNEEEDMEKFNLDCPEFNKLQVKNLNYSINGKKILKDINIEINKGDIIGIKGKTGSGKSTLLEIMCGLREKQNGEVIFNQNIKNTKLFRYNNLIGYLPQEIFLIQGSLKENIALGENNDQISLKKLEWSMNIAQLKDFYNGNRMRPDDIVQDKGMNLSGGEKQRIGLARVFYFKPKIIILDEPTSSLDKITAKKFEEIILDAKDFTFIISSHSDQTLNICDKIFKLDEN